MAGSDVLLASQINGGGCLAPPTPGERSSNVLSETLNGYFGEDKRSNYEKYEKELPASLAWRTSTQQQNCSGMGAYINPKTNPIPENPRDMGMAMRNGRRELVPRERKTGESLMWETASMRMSAYHDKTSVHHDPEILKL